MKKIVIIGMVLLLFCGCSRVSTSISSQETTSTETAITEKDESAQINEYDYTFEKCSTDNYFMYKEGVFYSRTNNIISAYSFDGENSFIDSGIQLNETSFKDSDLVEHIIYYYLSEGELHAISEYEDTSDTTITCTDDSSNLWVLQDKGTGVDLYQINIVDGTVTNLLSPLEDLQVQASSVLLSPDCKTGVIAFDFSNGGTLDRSERTDIDTSCEYFVYDFESKEFTSMNDLFQTDICTYDKDKLQDITTSVVAFSDDNAITVVSTNIERNKSTFYSYQEGEDVLSYPIDTDGDILFLSSGGDYSVIALTDGINILDITTGTVTANAKEAVLYGEKNSDESKLLIQSNEPCVFDFGTGEFTPVEQTDTTSRLNWLGNKDIMNYAIESDGLNYNIVTLD